MSRNGNRGKTEFCRLVEFQARRVAVILARVEGPGRFKKSSRPERLIQKMFRNFALNT